MSAKSCFRKKPKRQKPPRAVRLLHTFWNGEPTECRQVRVIIHPAPADKQLWWYAGLAGQEREAVRIDYHGETFYIDNHGTEDGEFKPGDGWLKVTAGMGSFSYRHAHIGGAESCTEVGPSTGEPARMTAAQFKDGILVL